MRCTDLVVEHTTERNETIVALGAVSLSIAPGERVALIGPSGSGKSSLLGAIAGLVTPTSGTVELLGSQMHTLGASERRALGPRLGIVAQDLALPPSLRVVHAVNSGRLGRWSLLRSLRSLVRPVGLHEVRSALGAVELADRWSARTGDLSGGEQQRVAVARVLHQQPDVVLADEPTSSVDPARADRVLQLLCPEDRSWTLVISLHDPALARRYADRIIGLRSGHVAFDRPVAEVSADDINALYRTTT